MDKGKGGPWYVTTTGNDSNSCNLPTAPCLTINGAIAQAAPSDTIYVAIGEYPVTTTVPVNLAKNLTVSGGWNHAFTEASGLSDIHANCGVECRALAVNSGVTANLTGFIIRGGDMYYGTGGGAYIAGTLTISDVIFTDNRASTGAGAYVETGGVLNVYNSTFHHNNYLASGGGIAVASGGQANIVNSTISENLYNIFDGILSNGGGGIANTGTMRIVNSTIVSNTSSSAPSNIAAVAGATMVKNTLVAFGNEENCDGAILSLGHNLENGHSCRFGAIGDRVGLDPMIRPLQNNGGRTPTHALRVGSPAINGGDDSECPAIDQRGVTRPSPCDIGAFEYTWTLLTHPGLSSEYILDLGLSRWTGVLGLTIPANILPISSTLVNIPLDEWTVPFPDPRKGVASFELLAYANGPITHLAQPLILTIEYDESQLKMLGLEEKTVRLMYYDEKLQAWQLLATEVDVEKNKATALMDRIAEYALAGEVVLQSSRLTEQTLLHLPTVQK